MPKLTTLTVLLLIGALASALCLYLSFQAGCAGDTKGGSLGDVQAALRLEWHSLAALLVAIACFGCVPFAGLKIRLLLRVAVSVAVVVMSLGILVLLSIQLEIYGVQRCFSQVPNLHQHSVI